MDIVAEGALQGSLLIERGVLGGTRRNPGDPKAVHV
jgi:hypothetical protein